MKQTLLGAALTGLLVTTGCELGDPGEFIDDELGDGETSDDIGSVEQAATGGGCAGATHFFYGGKDYGALKACISAPYRAYVRPDSYVNLRYPLSSCYVRMYLHSNNDPVAAGPRDWPCHPGTTTHYVMGTYYATSQQYWASVYIVGTNGVLGKSTSPKIYPP